MSMADIWKSLKTPEHRLAWVVAIAADALQIAVAPLFAEGGISPADVVLDVVVGALLIRLLGWHWAFDCKHVRSAAREREPAELARSMGCDSRSAHISRTLDGPASSQNPQRGQWFLDAAQRQ